jgi:hypothetical protein
MSDFVSMVELRKRYQEASKAMGNADRSLAYRRKMEHVDLIPLKEEEVVRCRAELKEVEDEVCKAAAFTLTRTLNREAL